MDSFYLEEAIRITGLPEKIVKDAFKQWPELDEKKKYVKFVSYRGIVVQGSEKYLSFTFCLREAIVAKNEELLDYFLNLGVPRIPIELEPGIWNYLPIQILVRNYIEKIPKIHELLKDFKDLDWGFAKIWALLLEDIKTRYLESIPVKSGRDIVEAVLTTKFIEQMSGSITDQEYEFISHFLYYLNQELFERLYLTEKRFFGFVLKISIEANDVNLFRKLMEKDSKKIKSILRNFYFSFENDPLDIFKVIYPYIGMERGKELIKHLIEIHALKCTRFMLEKVGDKVTLEDLILNAIKYSNFPIFIQLVGKKKLSLLHTHLEYCYSPGIWRYFLSLYPEQKFPEMPEIVKFFLTE